MSQCRVHKLLRLRHWRIRALGDQLVQSEHYLHSTELGSSGQSLAIGERQGVPERSLSEYPRVSRRAHTILGHTSPGVFHTYRKEQSVQ